MLAAFFKNPRDSAIFKLFTEWERFLTDFCFASLEDPLDNAWRNVFNDFSYEKSECKHPLFFKKGKNFLISILFISFI